MLYILACLGLLMIISPRAGWAAIAVLSGTFLLALCG